MTHRNAFFLTVFVFTMLVNILIVSCVHEPFVPMNVPPGAQDTTTIDTTNQDTTVRYCHPDSVVFATDVSPIIMGNCAYSGCHDAATMANGIDLSNYDRILETGQIEAGDAEDSDFYQALIDSDTADRMPKGLPKLSDEDIALLKKWIDQGALNIICTDTTDTSQAAVPSFASEIHPIIQTKCELNGCHASGGQSPVLETYAQISDKSDRVKARTQAKTMPPAGATQLTQSEIDLIKNWVDGGSPNN